MHQSGAIDVGQDAIEFFVDFLQMSPTFHRELVGLGNVPQHRIVDFAEKVGPFFASPSIGTHSAESIVGLPMHVQHQLGQVSLQMIEFFAGTTSLGFAEIHAVEMFHENVAVRIVQRSDLPGIDLRDGQANTAEKLELKGFVSVRLVDAMSANFKDGCLAVLCLQTQSCIDTSPDQRPNLCELRRIARPFFHDPPEHRPRNVYLVCGRHAL